MKWLRTSDRAPHRVPSGCLLLPAFCLPTEAAEGVSGSPSWPATSARSCTSSGSGLRLRSPLNGSDLASTFSLHWEQRHPDHRVTSQLGFDACYYAGLKKAKLSGDPYRPRKIIYSTYYRSTQPSFAVDITPQFEKKIAAVKCYRSQFTVDDSANKVFIPGVDIFEYMRVKDRELGMRIRAGYAEGYVQKELVAVDDPLLLGGVSI